MLHPYHKLWHIVMLLVVTLASLAAVRPAAASTNEVCVPGAQFCIPGRLGQYWQENGGLPIFGMPISPPAFETDPETGRTHYIQWFERGRFEEHEENQPPYDVLLGRLGVDRLGQMNRNWQAERRESGPKEGCLWFPQTGHNVCDQDPNGGSAADRGFKSYWQSEGLRDPALSAYGRSLALHGLPLTEARMETNSSGHTVLTQWFERGRFEWHPNNPRGFRVLLGLLGSELRQSRPVRSLKYFWPTRLPHGLNIQGNGSSANETRFTLKLIHPGSGMFDTAIQGGVGSELPTRAGGQAVTVRGRPGVAFATASGFSYSVYWEEDGYPYAIISGMGLQDVLDVARDLEVLDLAAFQRRLPNVTVQRGLKYFWPRMSPMTVWHNGGSYANETGFALHLAWPHASQADATITGGAAVMAPTGSGEVVTVRGQRGAAYRGSAGYTVVWMEEGQRYMIAGRLSLPDVLVLADDLERIDLYTFRQRLNGA